jgi:hypothetical protein
LCQDPLGVAAELFEWLNWNPTAATARFINSSRQSLWQRRMLGWVSNRRWYYNLHRDPGETLNAWQTLLTAEQVEEILAVTRSFPMDWSAREPFRAGATTGGGE